MTRPSLPHSLPHRVGAALNGSRHVWSTTTPTVEGRVAIYAVADWAEEMSHYKRPDRRFKIQGIIARIFFGVMARILRTAASK